MVTVDRMKERLEANLVPYFLPWGLWVTAVDREVVNATLFYFYLSSSIGLVRDQTPPSLAPYGID